MPGRAQEDESVHRRKACRWAALAAVAATASVWTMVGPLTAQTSPPQTSAGKVWPTKRVQVIVPFAPGSATDLLPRMVFEQVAANVGQTIIIENRPGGGGAIGVGAAAKAEADGHTILVHSNALVTAPAIQHMPYDPVQDFAGITPLGNVPLVLVVSPDKNIKTVKDLVAAAKAKPGAINYAAAGIGTPPASDRRALSPRRPVRGSARSLQGRSGSAHRSDHRKSGLLLLSAHGGDAVHPRGKGLGARREQLETHVGPAGGADHAGSGSSRFRFRFLGRHDGAEENPARDRRSHPRRNGERAARSVREGEALQARRRGDDHAAGGFRRAHRPRGADRRGARQGRRHRGEVIGAPPARCGRSKTCIGCSKASPAAKSRPAARASSRSAAATARRCCCCTAIRSLTCPGTRSRRAWQANSPWSPPTCAATGIRKSRRAARITAGIRSAPWRRTKSR